MHPPITANTPTSEVCKRILREQLYEIQTQTPIALEGSDIEGVHKMRVGYRRLRTCLKVFKPIIKKNVYNYFQSNAFQTGSLLGRIRDLDVLEENWELHTAINKDPDAVEYWQKIISPIYQQYRSEFAAITASQQYVTFLSYLEAFSMDENAGLKSNPKLPETAATIQGFTPYFLQSFLNTILSNAPDYEQHQPYPAYHQLRKELKQFRYSLEFFSPYLRPLETVAFIGTLIAIQDHLGYLNDSVVATGFIEDNFQSNFQSPGSNAEKFLGEYYSSRLQEKDRLTHEFLGIWKDFLATEPKQQLANCFPE